MSSIGGKPDIPGGTVGFRPTFMCCLVVRVTSLQGENLVLSYLQLSCCQLRFRHIIAYFVFGSLKRAELKDHRFLCYGSRRGRSWKYAHAHNCSWFRTSHVWLCLQTRAVDPNLTCLIWSLSPARLEDMAMMWMKVRSRSRPGMYYYFNRATQESTWKEPPAHLISEVCRAYIGSFIVAKVQQPSS